MNNECDTSRRRFLTATGSAFAALLASGCVAQRHTARHGDPSHGPLQPDRAAGACFSPDGRVMFVNVYSPAMTLAITGPWH